MTGFVITTFDGRQCVLMADDRAGALYRFIRAYAILDREPPEVAFVESWSGHLLWLDRGSGA